MAWKCEICKSKIMIGSGMVMIREDLWLSIANKEDVLCSSCISVVLGRNIESSDLKYSENGGKIPVNMLFAEKVGINY